LIKVVAVFLWVCYNLPLGKPDDRRFAFAEGRKVRAT